MRAIIYFLLLKAESMSDPHLLLLHHPQQNACYLALHGSSRVYQTLASRLTMCLFSSLTKLSISKVSLAGEEKVVKEIIQSYR